MLETLKNFWGGFITMGEKLVQGISSMDSSLVLEALMSIEGLTVLLVCSGAVLILMKTRVTG